MKWLILTSFLITKGQYEQLFPHHDPIYTYEAFVNAAKKFPAFLQTGDENTRKRELAAFFAEIAHESSNTGRADTKADPYAWGLYSKEERGCADGHCTQYNGKGTGRYQPVAGKSYHGRGPLQLSYVYNYGQAGDDLHLPLVGHPELVSTNGEVAFEAAIWFWMRRQDETPSCHEAMTAANPKGFGMTINIINGGRECQNNDPGAVKLRQERIGWYKHMASTLQVTTENNCDCIVGAYKNGQ